MRTPPLLADFTHTRACKPFCEKSLTLPGKKRIRQMMDAMGLISCEPLQTEYLPRQPEVPFVAEGSHVEIL